MEKAVKKLTNQTPVSLITPPSNTQPQEIIEPVALIHDSQSNPDYNKFVELSKQHNKHGKKHRKRTSEHMTPVTDEQQVEQNHVMVEEKNVENDDSMVVEPVEPTTVVTTVQPTIVQRRNNQISPFNKKLLMLCEDVHIKDDKDIRDINNTQLLWSLERRCPIFYCIKSEPSIRTQNKQSKPKPYIQTLYETEDEHFKYRELKHVVEQYIDRLSSYEKDGIITDVEKKALEQLIHVRANGQPAYKAICDMYKKQKKTPTASQEEKGEKKKEKKSEKKSSDSEKESDSDKKKEDAPKKKKKVKHDTIATETDDPLRKMLIEQAQLKLELIMKESEMRIYRQKQLIESYSTMSKEQLKKLNE